jgi:hypothetical protein
MQLGTSTRSERKYLTSDVSSTVGRPGAGSIFRLHKNVFAALHQADHLASVKRSSQKEKPQFMEKLLGATPGRTPSRCQIASFQQERDEIRTSFCNVAALATVFFIRSPAVEGEWELKLALPGKGR